MPSAWVLARTTITAAFQRMKARMRRSMCSSPGNHACWSTGMVLTYGVETVAGTPTWSSWARSSSLVMRNRARVRPWASTTSSRLSSHSLVSAGSVSGSWWTNPSKITRSMLAPAGTVRTRMGQTVAYTDGACLGTPGPGGWAWAVPDGPFASGAADRTTNQRMEIEAALEAVRALPRPLLIVSDSTYVVNCFRDGWWVGWEKRGWLNKAKKPVANRDLWEPLIELVKQGGVDFDWVKGHSGDP